MKVIPQIHSGGGPTLESGGRELKTKMFLFLCCFVFVFFLTQGPGSTGTHQALIVWKDQEDM